jgi:hypothetical protein
MDTAAKPTRENRTITVDFQNETTYVQLLGDGKAFVELVLACIMSLGFQLKHKAACRGGGCLTRHSHKSLFRFMICCASHERRPEPWGIDDSPTARPALLRCWL